MPVYEYYCRKCSTKFELLRSMTRSEELARCPNGHPDAAKTLSVFATTATGGDAFAQDAPASSGGGCGCGGGGCGCGGH